MSPLLARLEAAGFSVRLLPDLRLAVEHPGRPPQALLDELRAHRDELAEELRRRPVNYVEIAFPSEAPPPAATCLDCATPIPQSDLFCPPCYARRQETRLAPVVELAPYRRARTAARLAGRPCPDCGTHAWVITPRGDAYCGRCHPREVSR